MTGGMTLRHTGQETVDTLTRVPQFGHILVLRDAHTGHPKPSGGSREPQCMQKTGFSRAGGAWGIGGGVCGGVIRGTVTGSLGGTC